uniref:Uncharacterized protein n=2 Tax=Viruses TaxID=10239 RepID=A0A8S5T065_9VIRU|nr:MAG TPA: hypothetical protein [Myoviridae sp. ctQV19]DAF56335.1 MAG TPA: hypothetical protein [virus sp. ct0ba2]
MDRGIQPSGLSNENREDDNVLSSQTSCGRNCPRDV